jgi:regulation of enolase protein 1 (concanavalin A-like superfamily)
VPTLAISPDGNVLLTAYGWVYRSTDGGVTFARTSTQFGANQVRFHPADSSKAIALGGSGNGYYTRDGGRTWQPTSGLPTQFWGSRFEIAYARSQPETVYVAGSDNGAIYMSTDGGASFVRRYTGLPFAQAWFNLVIWVNPRDANHLIVGATELYQSLDGGLSWNTISNSSIHVDHHVIVEHPGFDNVTNRTVFFGNDGGVYETQLTPGAPINWIARNRNLGITQFYGAAGSAASGRILGGTQDNGTLLYRPDAGTRWNTTLGGDGGFCASDPTNPDVFYGEYQFLQIHRSTNGGASAHPIYSGIRDAGTQNAGFIAPFILDPNDPNRMLAGGQSLWRSNNVKAPVPTWSNIKPASGGTLSAIAVAAGNPDVIWVGNSGGYVFKTTNGTSASPTWTQMYETIGNTFVTRIAIDPANHDVVYVSRGGFSKGAIVRSEDGGLNWTDVTGTGDTGLPEVPVRDVELDPFDALTIYAGTEVGLFVSHDRGATWELPTDGPANVSVDELFIMGTTIVAATHGRGLFALDLRLDGMPVLTSTPDRLDFPPRAVGTTSPPQPITIGNTGTAPLTVQSLWVDGTDSGDFHVQNWGSCREVTLPPGASCSAEVFFWPQEQGTRRASVRIASTAPGSPHAIPLSGGVVADAPLPQPWVSQDIGSVGVAGRASYSNGTFTVEGAGADIWGASDGFHFVHQTLTGDGEITARVVAIENTAAWTKMGVMIRGALTGSSAHGLMLVSSAKGVAFQRRTTDGGLSTHTSGGAGAAPRWVRLRRSGSTLTAFVSTDGAAWTTVGQDTIALPATAYVGLASHSHDVTQLATATFDSVTVKQTAALPSGWQSADVGAVGVTGSARESGGTFTVEGAGADVWGTADAFHYVYHPLTGDGTITARVASIENTAAWTKMGVMIRGALTPSSPHAFMLVSSGKGLAFQRRNTTGGISTNTSGGLGTAPRWVRLRRTGGVVTAFVSMDGSTWTTVGQDTIDLPPTAYVGIVAHSHVTTELATAVFDNVALANAALLPDGWQSADIGAVGVAGSATGSSEGFTVSGAGADVWGSADALHFAYTAVAGDATITARVTALDNVAAWTKVGVMVRESLDPGSAHAFMIVSAGKGLAFQRRETTGGLTTHTAGPAGTAPFWVRLQRSGSLITASASPDGVAWTVVGQNTFAMRSAVWAGLAVSSHDSTRLATARFERVEVRVP